jgi:formyl-CoA transferase
VFRPNALREVCAALGIGDLSRDPRFASPAAIAQHADPLRAALQARLRERSTTDWVRTMEDADIMCAPVQPLAEAMDDPQVRHNEMVVDVEHPPHGRVRIAGVPVKLSGAPGRIRRSAPAIGQDTVQVLQRFGYTEAEIADLRQRGVVACAEPDR